MILGERTLYGARRTGSQVKIGLEVISGWQRRYLPGSLGPRRRAARDQQNLSCATEVSGTQLIQEFITDGCHGSPATSRENGFVAIPQSAS
jgi:hypothetical protein